MVYLLKTWDPEKEEKVEYLTLAMSQTELENDLELLGEMGLGILSCTPVGKSGLLNHGCASETLKPK